MTGHFVLGADVFRLGESQIDGSGAVGKISEQGTLAFYILDSYR